MRAEEMKDQFKIARCGIEVTHPAETRYREVKPHWWSRKTVLQPYEFIPDPERYSLSDALAAIRLLGETGSQEALDFLEDLYTPSTDSDYEEYFVSGGSEPRDDDWKYNITTSIIYPRACGELAAALKFDVGYETGYCDYDDGSENETPDYVEQLRNGELEPPSESEAHQIIREAIGKLRSRLRQSADYPVG
ncbi:hypothetical protein SDC9_80522 [bioreactor metagenome]|uniref:Uncharacterized protein n=1 Tax=bioreactor metagenome TaxID=1076179 RepID=A0A644Z1Q1_9ZZZZ